jgi:hypothetical protein
MPLLIIQYIVLPNCSVIAQSYEILAVCVCLRQTQRKTIACLLFNVDGR